MGSWKGKGEGGLGKGKVRRGGELEREGRRGRRNGKVRRAGELEREGGREKGT